VRTQHRKLDFQSAADLCDETFRNDLLLLQQIQKGRGCVWGNGPDRGAHLSDSTRGVNNSSARLISYFNTCSEGRPRVEIVRDAPDMPMMFFDEPEL
jgi:hypothetical protein